MSPAPRPLRVHIDTDPGLDDLVALAFAAASPELEIVGLSTVAGNAALDAVTHNTLGWCAIAGVDVPVGRGASAPLELPPIDACYFHGADGRCGVPLPAPERPAADDALTVLRRSLTAGGAEALIALGPLTNLAQLARTDPALLEGRELLWMGGSLGAGNVTPEAEFNCLVDPHAVEAVLASGAQLRVIGLDVTTQVCLEQAQLERQRWPATARGRLTGELLAELVEAETRVSGKRGALLHDPTAIAAAIDRELLSWGEQRLAIDLDEGPARGRMRAHASGRAAAVAREVRAAEIGELFIERLADWCAEGAR